MTTMQASDRFTALPDEQTLSETVVALEEHGFSVKVVDDLDAAREAVLARIPEGSSVMTTVASGRSSRSTRRIPAASTSSSSAKRSGSDDL